MTALDDLIAAVEAGTMHDGHVIRTAIVSQMGGWVVAAFTGDLNAALRLHKAILPGCGWDIWRTLDHLPNGMSRKMYGCNLPMTDTAYTDNPARSWLLAILRALKAKEAGNE